MLNLLAPRRVEADPQEVFRLMGYPDGAGVSAPVLEVCREQMRRVGDFAAPWGSHREHAIEAIEGSQIRLACGSTLNSRRLAAILRRAEALKVCLVTLGSGVSEEIQRLIDGGWMVEALAFDAAATATTSALMAHLRERICIAASERNCGTTLPYGPGYTGWELRDLPALFSCFAADDPPVRLNAQLMMVPQKSLLGVVGIVPGRRARPEAAPCRLCDLVACSVRRSLARRENRVDMA